MILAETDDPIRRKRSLSTATPDHRWNGMSNVIGAGSVFVPSNPFMPAAQASAPPTPTSDFKRKIYTQPIDTQRN